jgi:hypothetical protein
MIRPHSLMRSDHILLFVTVVGQSDSLDRLNSLLQYYLFQKHSEVKDIPKNIVILVILY